MRGKETIQKIKQAFATYQLAILIGLGVCILMMLVMMNKHIVQMATYVFKDEKTEVIEMLQKDISKPSRRDDWYFKKGINYLLENLDEDSKLFLETYYKDLDAQTQEAIVASYNKENILFQYNEPLFHSIATTDVGEVYKVYLNRMDAKTIQTTIKRYMGEEIKVTQDTVNRLYRILSMQSKKISLDDFKFSMYELMSFPHKGDLESVSLKLLDYIQPESVKEVLFTELKTRPIEIGTLSLWIDLFNKKKIITTSEYANFIKSHGAIKRFQEQYKQMVLQEVDLMNIKKKIDIQTEEMINKVDKAKKDIDVLNKQRATKQSELERMSHYKTVELYVLDQYDNGDYEVAIPEKSWLFNTYKPSKYRIRLKVNVSTINKQGVMAFKVYDKGVSSDGLPYYVEVSQEERDQMAQLEQGIAKDQKAIENKNLEIDNLNQEIAHIRKTNNYEQILNNIEEIQKRKESIQLEINKNKNEIQNLFQIGEIIIDTKK